MVVAVLTVLFAATVPAFLTPLNFLVVAGLLGGLGWIARSTYRNGESTDSVGQLLYQTETARSREHPRDRT